MKKLISHTLGFIFAVVVLTGCVAEETQAQEFKEGVHYVTLASPIPTQAPAGQVEVAELFWYGCPHCLSLEPTIDKFLANKPANVAFQRVPATISPRWAYHARLFYAGQMLDTDGSKGIHKKIFEAIQTQRRKIDNDEALTRFFVEQGFSKEQVASVLNSMEMTTKLARADEIGAKSQADSVPTIIVAGKYRTAPSMVGSEDALLQVIDYLVKRESK